MTTVDKSYSIISTMSRVESPIETIIEMTAQYKKPEIPQCSKIEPYYYLSLLGQKDIEQIVLPISGTSDKTLVLKKKLGYENYLATEGSYSGYVGYITHNRFNPLRPLLAHPEKEILDLVNLKDCAAYLNYHPKKIADAVNFSKNFPFKLATLISSRGIPIDTTKFIENITAYQEWWIKLNELIRTYGKE